MPHPFKWAVFKVLCKTLSENDVLVKKMHLKKQIAKRVAKCVEDCFKMRSLVISEILTQAVRNTNYNY